MAHGRGGGRTGVSPRAGDGRGKGGTTGGSGAGTGTGRGAEKEGCKKRNENICLYQVWHGLRFYIGPIRPRPGPEGPGAAGR